ncbi:hypothetical protein, partial [Klebsiella pneumoniae]|uniref:hypothetical protein n=1 Tax=Klebsiella pneumoniae TaxID=573 RepID=UPI00272FF792
CMDPSALVSEFTKRLNDWFSPRTCHIQALTETEVQQAFDGQAESLLLTEREDGYRLYLRDQGTPSGAMPRAIRRM